MPGLARLSDRAARAAVAIALVVFCLAYTLPALSSGSNEGIWDWDHHFAQYEAERQALLEHRVAPFWNPYIAGGTILLQHPLAASFWPDFAVLLAFGVPLGVKLLLVLRFALGLAGGFLLARAFHLGRAGALLASLVMNGAGSYASHVAFGHFEWTLFGYVPWALLGLLRFAERGSLGWCALASVCIAGLYLGGCVYLLFGLGFFVAIFFACEVVRTRQPVRAGRVVLALILAGGLCGAKLLPASAWFSEHPRKTKQYNRLLQHLEPHAVLEVPRALAFVFLRRGYDYSIEFAERPSHVGRVRTREEQLVRFRLFQDVNYDGYLGALPLLLAGLGIARRHPARAGLAASLLVLLTLALSDSIERASGFHPWLTLKSVPSFGSLGVGGRFMIFVVLPLALLAGHGLDALQGFLSRFPRAAAAVAALCVAWVGVDLARHGAWLLSQSFPHEHARVEAAPFVTREKPLHGSDFATVRARIGAVRGHSNIGLRRWRAAIPVESPEYRGEVFLANGTGIARLLEIRPNDVRVRVDARRDDVLVVNQRYVRGWHRVDRAAPIGAAAGRIATPVDPSDTEVHLRFRPPRFVAGWIVSVATAVSLAAGVAVQRRRAARRSP